nr:RNA 2',3'-cyclic phosphodiesterase [Legionella jordanis]
MGVRVFFAVKLVEPIYSIIETVLLNLQQKLSIPIRWSAAENLHVTLAFLGQIEAEDIERLIQYASLELENQRAFYLKFQRLKLFPNKKHPRIISLGVASNPNLNAMAAGLKQAILNLNYSIETRPFRAHLTLGRIKNVHPTDELLEPIALPFIPPMPVKEIHLLKSRPSQTCSDYTSLAQFALN